MNFIYLKSLGPVYLVQPGASYLVRLRVGLLKRQLAYKSVSPKSHLAYGSVRPQETSHTDRFRRRVVSPTGRFVQKLLCLQVRFASESSCPKVGLPTSHFAYSFVSPSSHVPQSLLSSRRHILRSTPITMISENRQIFPIQRSQIADMACQISAIFAGDQIRRDRRMKWLSVSPS